MTRTVTASTEALFITAAIDAMQNRFKATVDVEGAYLHADMVGEVLIKIEPNITQLLLKISPEYEKFILYDGSLVVKLKKALYGCIGSARLFYDNISKVLTNFGFVRNPYDFCIFNKISTINNVLLFYMLMT
jgi:hypothetical protein